MGAKKEGTQATGRSRGGLTTKIHVLTDTFGNLVHFKLTGGNEHDGPHAKSLLRSIGTEKVIADKAYDSNELLATIDEMGASAVIPSKANRKQQRTIDSETYKRRNRVER